MDQTYLLIALAIVAFLLIFLIILLIKQNRGDDFPSRHRRTHSPKRKGMAKGMAIGIGLGAGIGVALDNVAVGIGLGVAIGAAFGQAFESADKKREEKTFMGRQVENDESSSSQKAKIIGLLAVLIGILILGLILFFLNK